MAAVELRHLHHRYSAASEPGAFEIKGLNIAWEEGTANALLGPSGCGKTTLLNILSGLLRPMAGSVLFDGTAVNHRTPSERQIAQVFQFPVVYDTMNVFDNLAFPLRNRRLPEQEIRTRVEEIAELLGLGALLKAGAGKLSAAEKQVVALGRGIVRKDTAAVLLDEPLTVIDPVQKLDLRRKLRQVQQELRITMIYVTHDQHEALTFADHVTVMNEGAVVQSATPEQLFLRPETPFVGHFIGSPGMNLMSCTRGEGTVRLEGVPGLIPAAAARKVGGLDGTVRLGIRPEFVETSPVRKENWAGLKLADADHLGACQVLTLQTGELRIKARVDDRFEACLGMDVWVNFPEDKIRIYEDGKLVS